MTDHSEFLLLAAAAVDGSLSPVEAARLETHLTTCPTCRSAAQHLREDAGRLRTLPPVAPPAWIRAEFATEIGRLERRHSRPAVRSTSQLRLGGAFILLALITALLVLVIALVGTQPPKPIAVATPFPSPTRSASPELPPAGAPIPVALQSKWVGEPRQISGLQAAEEGISLRMEMSATELWFSNVLGARQYDSSAAVDPSGTVQLVSLLDSAGCKSGALGQYTFAASTGGTRITGRAINDPCHARADALSAEFLRVGCKRAQDCLGDLEAGTYPSQYLLGTWGWLKYTVPDGWANSADNEVTGQVLTARVGSFSLTPSADFAREDVSGPPPGTVHEVDVVEWPMPLVQNKDCTNQVAPSGAASTIESLAAYLRGLPGIRATPPRSTTITATRACGST